MSGKYVPQNSPGITEVLVKPTPMLGEDKVSYERHLKTLQVSLIFVLVCSI